MDRETVKKNVEGLIAAKVGEVVKGIDEVMAKPKGEEIPEEDWDRFVSICHDARVFLLGLLAISKELNHITYVTYLVNMVRELALGPSEVSAANERYRVSESLGKVLPGLLSILTGKEDCTCPGCTTRRLKEKEAGETAGADPIL